MEQDKLIYLRHDTIVIVSGGSGTALFISIIRELIDQNTTFKYKSPESRPNLCLQDSSSLSLLHLILPTFGTPSDISNLELQIEAYRGQGA